MVKTNIVQLESMAAADLVRLFEGIHKRLDNLTPKPAQSEADTFLTRFEVAELFKISLPTVHAWVHAGILKPYKIGNKTRFLLSEVKAAAICKRGCNMISPLVILNRKESALIAAIDEMAPVMQTGRADNPTIATVLTSLCAYPLVSRYRQPKREWLADCSVQAAAALLSLWMAGEAPANAIKTAIEALHMALENIYHEQANTIFR